MPASAPQPPKPTPAVYASLDGRVHYYAITLVRPLEHHFVATYLSVEGGYCNVVANQRNEVTVLGCGFPSGVAEDDHVGREYAALLPALRTAVLRAKPEAQSLHFRYDGTYRSVLLEEEVPCSGKHGHGYNQVELHFDAELRTLVAAEYHAGSNCGASPFYWVSEKPLWVPFTSSTPLLAPSGSTAAMVIPSPLVQAVTAALAAPPASLSEPPALSAPQPEPPLPVAATASPAPLAAGVPTGAGACPNFASSWHKRFTAFRSTKGFPRDPYDGLSTCCALTEKDLVCKTYDRPMTHWLGKNYGPSLLGLHLGAASPWLYVPYDVTSHGPMKYPPAALVRLNVATDAQQSTVELSIQRGVCPRPCSKRPGSCALAEADAELACNAVGRHPVPRD